MKSTDRSLKYYNVLLTILWVMVYIWIFFKVLKVLGILGRASDDWCSFEEVLRCAIAICWT